MSAARRKKPKPSAKKKLIAKVSANALDTVDVVFTVKQFVDVLTVQNADPDARLTTNRMWLKDPLKYKDRVRVFTKPGTREQALKISRGGAILRFSIKPESPQHSYFPLGIAFKQLNPNGTGPSSFDVLGQRNFSFGSLQISDTSGTLTIRDRFNDRGRPNIYKFSLIIQRKHSGEIGIIDPRIEHEPI